jgi:hypothetical protein
MASFTLDDIRAAADAKYASLDIEVDGETVTLVNALRLSKEKRAALTSLQEGLDKEGEESVEQEQVLADSIRIIAATEDQAERLLSHVGDDLAVLATIFDKYAKDTQAGEA